MAVGSDPARCPTPFFSHSDSQEFSRPASSLQRGRNERTGRRAALLRPGGHSVLHHTFPFGVSASRDPETKADIPPRGSAEGEGVSARWPGSHLYPRWKAGSGRFASRSSMSLSVKWERKRVVLRSERDQGAQPEQDEALATRWLLVLNATMAAVWAAKGKEGGRGVQPGTGWWWWWW